MPLSSGDTLGAYTVIDQLGAGGMGEVYRARDTRLDRDVAVKVLPDQFKNDPAVRDRFEREAKAVAALNHSNILTIHDVGSDKNTDYVVTELLEGETLNEKMKRDGALPWKIGLGIARDVARGLAAAHEKNIIHRDIKPSNIFLTKDGSVKILDFGLAKNLNVQPPPASAKSDSVRADPMTTKPGDATTPGTLIGTIGYMSPEQARGLPASKASDVFSLGCVLYQMLTGNRPFVGETATDTLIAIIKEEAAPLRRNAKDVPAGLEKVLQKMLGKNPEMRYESAAELNDALAPLDPAHATPESTPSPAGQILRMGGAIAAVSIIAVLIFSMMRSSEEQSNVDWAREVALPDILRLADEEAWGEAYTLALRAEELIPTDPLLRDAFARITNTIDIITKPEGAAVSYKPYDSPDAPWIGLGTSNLSDIRVARGTYRWRIEKEGRVTRIVPGIVSAHISGEFDLPPGAPPLNALTFKLYETGSVPEGMVPVDGGFGLAALTGLGLFPSILADFYVDRTEVTNAAFKEFVDAGGYDNPDFWQQAFSRDGLEIPREEAMALFLDSTGRPGPAGWELGNYPEARGDYPVGGVSWYEAAAYAQFRGKSLPTIYHWARAALPLVEMASSLSPSLLPMSNFNGRGPIEVGSNKALSAAGAYDMAGNLREWCWNASGDLRYNLGGAWEEPPYTFTMSNAQSPFDRSKFNGFRCAAYPKGKEPHPALTNPVIIDVLDFENASALSDDAFEMLVSQSVYEKKPLNAHTESVSEANADWKRETVTFDAAYGNERVIVHLDIPVHQDPPYKVAVYFPGANMLFQNRFSTNFTVEPFDAIPKSGRVLVRPIFARSFERGGGQTIFTWQKPAVNRQLNRMWRQDVQRTIDYLETRDDVNTDDLAFIGLSLGAGVAGQIAAIEKRVRVLVLVAGGLPPSRDLANTFGTLGLWPRVTIPTLTLNGRFDYIFPIENQKALARVLGTPDEHTRHVVYETGHIPLPRTEVIKEMLNWLDKYQPIDDTGG